MRCDDLRAHAERSASKEKHPRLDSSLVLGMTLPCHAERSKASTLGFLACVRNDIALSC